MLRPSRFALVGLVGIAVNAAALAVFTESFGIHYALSAVLASQVSTLNNFILTELWVFRDHSSHRHMLFRYLAFNALNIATLFIRIPLLVIFTERFGVHYLAANVIAIGLTFGIRYFVADNWIWAGRDTRDQVKLNGWFNYDVHGIARLRSRIPLPELAAFNVSEMVEPDIVVARRRLLGGRPRARISVAPHGSVIEFREQLGVASAAFNIDLSGPIRVEANWLLSWSHHVLYTNVVEPLLRFMLVSRDAVLLHCASLDADRGAILLSAQTDTGKTSTVLRLLKRQEWAFMGDDMAVVLPDGRVLSYPKPLTLSSHTMSAVSDSALPLADRIMLGVRSRVHSKQGRSIGHALGRLPVPIVTINCIVQLLVPPPKYHITSLVDCDQSASARLDAVILMERGSEPVTDEPGLERTLDVLLDNTEDAYTFPPFGWISPLLTFGGLHLDALRVHERDLLRASISGVRRVRMRVTGHEWPDLIPSVLDGTPSPHVLALPVAARAPVGR